MKLHSTPAVVSKLKNLIHTAHKLVQRCCPGSCAITPLAVSINLVPVVKKINQTVLLIDDTGAWVSGESEVSFTDKALLSGAGVVSYSSQLVAGKNYSLHSLTVDKAFNKCEGSCLPELATQDIWESFMRPFQLYHEPSIMNPACKQSQRQCAGWHLQQYKPVQICSAITFEHGSALILHGWFADKVIR